MIKSVGHDGSCALYFFVANCVGICYTWGNKLEFDGGKK